MSTTPLGHERQITFMPRNGHNHNGENSSPVELAPGQVKMEHLDPGILDQLRETGGEVSNTTDAQLIAVPDLEIETNSINPGGSVTGSIDWVGICVIRSTRVVMSVDTECTITFYHAATYADEDREFRAQRCSNKFLWEGAWIHYDEDGSNKVHYKIQNTGAATARFNLTLKAGTLIANGYSDYVATISNQEDSFNGDVQFIAGNGVKITADTEANTLTFDADVPEAITISRMALAARKHTSFTSSTTTTNTGSGLNSIIGTSGYVNFGTGPQWMKMDYGAIYNVGRIVITPYADGRIFNDVKVEVSTDDSNWTTVFSQQQVVGAMPGISIETPIGLQVRYVKFYSNGSSASTGNHLSGAIIYTISDKIGT